MSKKPSEYDILLSNVRQLMKLKHFRFFLWYVMGMAPMYATTFSPNSSMAFQEGRRSMVVDLIQILTDCDPELYPKMLLEYARHQDFLEDENAQEDGTGS